MQTTDDGVSSLSALKDCFCQIKQSLN